MPVLSRERSDRKKKAAVAHIVFPASKLAAAKAGEEVTSLCGDATIKGDPSTNDAPVCRACFLKQLEADDKRVEADAAAAKKTADERSTNAVAQARTDGEAAGRRNHATELQRLAVQQAAEARTQAEASRYEDLGKALKLKLVDGGEATVRKNRVASVQLLQNGGNHVVVVDGNAVHVGADETLARKHYDDVHAAVFGVPAQ